MLKDSKHILLPIFFLTLLLLVSGITMGQVKSKDQLKKEKQEKINRIKEVEKILNETANKKEHTLGELHALNQRIREQENLIRSIRQEVSYLDTEISDTRMIVESLESDVKKLKKEYSSMVYAAYKASNGINQLTFLFSASSFSEFFSRWKHMQQYSEARKKQAIQIQKVASTLLDQIAVIEEKRNEKTVLLNEQLNENKSLVSLKNQRGKVMVSLESQETKLRKDLETNKAAISSLERKITEIIKAEIASANSSPSKANTTVNSNISGSFEKNKAKFKWPVDGFISQKFGRHNHAALKGVIIENDGIGIQTKQNEVARAIFEGDVKAVGFVPSMGYYTLIKHGEYFTVYSGLKEPYVKAGQKVSAGENIGEVVTKPEGVTELWFEIWKGKDHLNPELWLVKR
ncbi:MAG: peptidoglycan DD-metalloendopeptidase family protein [Cyclobacteriaceae bacterium]|nr:peptidoglycan DD-metalloendopeptidase family protein [Cyclobacteriaceae bacterium]